MKTTVINPWEWQNNFGYSQAIEVKHGESTLYCAGQTAMDANGEPVAGDMSSQIKLSFENLHTVMQQAGYHPANLVRINYYTTSIPAFFEAYGDVIAWTQAHNCAPSSTLLQVSALAFPELMVEIEATFVK